MLGSVLADIMATLMIGVSAIMPNQCFYTNENGLQMTESQYEQLQTIGYNESEIASMENEKFNKLMSMCVINTNVEVSVLNENDSIINVGSDILTNDDNAVFENDIVYNDEELLQKGGITVEDEDFFNESIDIIDNDEILEQEFGNSDIATTSYLSNSAEKAYSVSDAAKTMVTYASYVKVGNEYKIYIKQNVTWISTPDNRFSDILAINYTNNLRVGESSSGYPDVEMHLKYKQTDYSKTGWKNKNPKYKIKTTTKDVDLSYSGSDQSAYNHKIGDYFAFKFDLPKNTSTNGSSQRYYLIYKTSYSDFYVSMEATFDTNNASITGTEMQSHYVHQTGAGKIDWGKLTFTTSQPYITYSTNFWVDDPSFETALFNWISLKFN